ncbi:MAG TPA: type II toxin-antitoxin system VapC family toxin [Candidatus Limnocylindria bacterium]|nr:type II toxin-antitoxin system VapC family toxin [Candidatus Limnocylindria bacterium]
MRYLLDSTLLIDHANADPAATVLFQRLFEEGHELYTCDVVTCETLTRGDDAQRRLLSTLLDALDYVATSPEMARWAGESRRQRHLAGRRQALADALIGGVASVLGATVVTRNRPDFERQGVPILTY